METQCLKQVWICAVHRQRLAPCERLMRPDLVEHHEERFDLLSEGRRMVDIALVEMLVLERLIEAFDHAVGLRRVVAREDAGGRGAADLPT